MSEASSANRVIARAAGTVLIAFVIGNLVGLLRQILVANAFGTRADMEAFNAANRVSETLFNLVAGGALASAFIPTFTSILTLGEKQRAWKLASAIANLIIVVLISISVLAIIFAPQIVHYVLAPGFASNPEKEALTVQLLRLMLPSAIIFGLSGLVMGILNSNQRFFLPALAPTMYQLGMIFGVVFLSPAMGIYGLAWGVLIGASLHLIIQIPLLLGLSGSYTATFGLHSSDVREVGRLIGPRLLGVAVVQLNFWINTRLASQFEEGSVTGIVIAFALMLMPQAAIAQSIAIAALPTFSAQVAAGKLKEMRSSLAASLRGALVFSLPASFGLILLRTPIVAMLYQRGEFTAHSTELVSWALLWYASGLIGHALVEILSRAFYSLHDTKTPVFVGISAMSLNVFFSYFWSDIFIRIGWLPLGGLALANTLATAIEAVALFILMQRRLQGIEAKRILVGMLQALVCSSAMVLVIWTWIKASVSYSTWIISLGGLLLGLVVFLAFGYLIGLSEIKNAIGTILRTVRV